MIEVPHWIQVSVLLGVALVVIVVPIRILYEMTKDSRARSKRSQDLTQRIRERFQEVSRHPGVFGQERIEFKYEGRSATILQPADDQIMIRLEPKIEPKFHLIARTRGSMTPEVKIMWDSLRVLSRIRTNDPLIDESVAIYATPIFGNYLREALLDGIPAEGKPTGLAESLVILRRMPGIRWFELRMSPGGGFALTFSLEADDLLYRPDELEAAVHHVFQLYDVLVMY